MDIPAPNTRTDTLRQASAAAKFVGKGSWVPGLRYGFMGLPLAFLALPLYVVLPNLYATTYALPLAALGMVLLAARMSDALLDPLIGRWCDRWFAHSPQRVLAMAAIAGAVMALGLWALLMPPVESLGESQSHTRLLVWVGAWMVVVYAAYSVASVAHQNWGARLGGNETQRTRIVAWREGMALVGVLVASALPSLAGLSWTTAGFAFALTLGLSLWLKAPQPASGACQQVDTAFPAELRASPLRSPEFRRLMLVYVVNGTATAIPATLVLFFVQDRIQASSEVAPAFLATYFLFAALSMPIWLRLVDRMGIARTWLAGMVLAVLTFVWAATLGAGDVIAFGLVCALSGIAAGTDLALPSALLNGTLEDLGERGRNEGAYLGWWSLATKLNLALAAGLALPALEWLGYAPGSRSPTALQTLTWAYCLLPCALKLVAAGLLWHQSRTLDSSNPRQPHRAHHAQAFREETHP